MSTEDLGTKVCWFHPWGPARCCSHLPTEFRQQAHNKQPRQRLLVEAGRHINTLAHTNTHTSMGPAQTLHIFPDGPMTLVLPRHLEIVNEKDFQQVCQATPSPGFLLLHSPLSSPPSFPLPLSHSLTHIPAVTEESSQCQHAEVSLEQISWSIPSWKTAELRDGYHWPPARLHFLGHSDLLKGHRQ